MQINSLHVRVVVVPYPRDGEHATPEKGHEVAHLPVQLPVVLVDSEAGPTRLPKNFTLIWISKTTTTGEQENWDTGTVQQVSDITMKSPTHMKERDKRHRQLDGTSSRTLCIEQSSLLKRKHKLICRQ